MDNPNHMRGSQRAIKMLQAQKQQNQGGAQHGTKITTDRFWAPKASLTNLDPTQATTTTRPSSVFSSFSGAASILRQQEQKRDVPLVSTPLSTRVKNSTSYASPEASVPSVGGITFLGENSNINGMLDLETSRMSSIVGNSNFEFSQPDFANGNSNMASQPNNGPSNDAAARTPFTSSAVAGAAEAECDVSEDHDEDETLESMCFSLGDGKVTALVATADGAYCIAGFSSGAIRLFDLTKDGNLYPEDRFGLRIGMIESQRGSVQVWYVIEK